MSANLPLWRSLLYVPANVERFVARAHLRGADALIVDLEDSIQPDDKAAARRLAPEAIRRVGQAGADVLVRINRPWRLAVADLEAVVSPAVCALCLPKVPDAGHLRAVAEVCDELEAERGMAPGHTRFIAMVETAEAFFRLEEIARAHPRVVGLVLGVEDFASDMGMPPEPEGLHMPVQMAALAARAAGIRAFGTVGSVAQFADREAYREQVRRAKRLGFTGAMCIHPEQAKVLNEEHMPAAADVAYARRVLAADAAAKQEGRGSYTLDGRMIDIPIVERARNLLARAEALAARGIQ